MPRKPSARSWIVLAGVTFYMFLDYGAIKCFGVLLPETTEQLSTKTSLIVCILFWCKILFLEVLRVLESLLYHQVSYWAISDKKKKKKKKRPPSVEGTGISDFFLTCHSMEFKLFSLCPAPSILINSRLLRGKITDLRVIPHKS